MPFGLANAVTPTEFFKWWVTDPETGVRKRTSYRMMRDAEQRFPGGEPDLGTREVSDPPDSPNDRNVARHSG